MQNKLDQKNEIVGRASAHYQTNKKLINKAYKTLTGIRLYDEPDLALIAEDMQFLDIEYELEQNKKYNEQFQHCIINKYTGEILEPLTLQSLKLPSTPSILYRK